MIKTILSAAKAALGVITFLLVFTTSAAAQDKIAEGAKEVTAQMKTQLALNDNQYTQVLDVNRTFLKKIKDSKTSGITGVEKAKKMQAFNEERDSKLKSVLTATQYKKYAAGRSENIKKLKESVQ